MRTRVRTNEHQSQESWHYAAQCFAACNCIFQQQNEKLKNLSRAHFTDGILYAFKEKSVCFAFREKFESVAGREQTGNEKGLVRARSVGRP